MKGPILINPQGDAASSLRPDQQECIKLLGDMLEDAKKGKVWSCLVVACGPSDFGSAMAGADAPRLMLGLEVAKATIIERVTGKKSVINR